MSINNNINALFLATTILAGLLLGGYVAQREYHTEKDRVVAQALAEAKAHPELQILIYNRDRLHLANLLDSFTSLDTVTAAAAYDTAGVELSTRGPASDELGSLSKARRYAPIADGSIVVLSRDGDPLGTGFWSALFSSESMLHLTHPVISSVNPAKRGLTNSDFFVSLAEPENNTSLRVMGYVHLGLDRSALITLIGPTIAKVLGIYLLLTLIAGAAIFVLTRHFTRPLSQVKKLADDIANGELAQELKLEGNSEFRELANVLNNVLSNVLLYRREAEVDRKLLARKMDENASLLSQRDDELLRAEEQISAARDRLHKLSYYDPLTRLPNRVLFSEQMQLLLNMNERDKAPLALLLLKVRGFRRINDTMGQAAGDTVLAEVSRRLTAQIRRSDVLSQNSEQQVLDVSRMSSDEFSVVLNRMDKKESAGVVAQRILDAVSTPLPVEGQELVLTPVIGIAIAPEDATDLEDLVRAASVAMDSAKGSAEAGYAFYEPSMAQDASSQIQLEHDLRKATELNQLQLVYQPLVDVADGSIDCAEALVRWQHPELGMLPPSQFLPMAERIGVMTDIGDWVVREALRELKALTEEGLELPRIAINVSASQWRPDFAEYIKDSLLDAGLQPASLELGLAESILLDDDHATLIALESLQKLGVLLSLDNFGISSTPLRQLTQYPLDALRVDRNLVAGCNHDAENANLVQAVISVANSLKLRAVVQGVETEDEFRFLENLGVRAMQGYLFSRPVPAATLRELLQVPWYYMSQIQAMKIAAEMEAV